MYVILVLCMGYNMDITYTKYDHAVAYQKTDSANHWSNNKEIPGTCHGLLTICLPYDRSMSIYNACRPEVATPLGHLNVYMTSSAYFLET